MLIIIIIIIVIIIIIIIIIIITNLHELITNVNGGRGKISLVVSSFIRMLKLARRIFLM